MEQSLVQLIDYFRRCYRADNYGISISDVTKIAGSRQLVIEGNDELACGDLPKLPLVDDKVEPLVAQVEKYQKERLLVYGCFFVQGKVSSTGFSASRTLNSPLIYFPARISAEDSTYYLSIDHSDLRINRPLLRQLLKPELDSAALETFPSMTWPIAIEDVALLSKWLRDNTVVVESEEVGRWPRLQSLSTEVSKTVSIVSACSLILAERSKGSRGVLHELNQLVNTNYLSPALSSLLGGQPAEFLAKASEPDLIPGLLSQPQLTALNNAAAETVSLISGPPGTGKSYTIAAVAIDRMLHGESVLVVSKSEQAINVVGEKLLDAFNLKQGYVHTPERNFQKSMKEYLDGVLSMGVTPKDNPEEVKQALTKVRHTLDQASHAFQRKLRLSRWISSHLAQTSGDWWRTLTRPLLQWLSGWSSPSALWQYPHQVGQLQAEREALCAQYINAYREQQLQGLLDNKRGELSKFLQALKARNSKTQKERFDQTDFDTVLDAFPIWLVNVNELNNVLPLRPDMFDVVIFDEATQCDMATAIPALQRAKRAVIVGDGKQLRHVSFVSRREQQALFEFCQLDPALEQQYSYRDQSVLDIASDAIQSQKAVCLLDEYYRGKADLISFSNAHFYQDRLKVMRSRPGELIEPALGFTKVDGERARTGRNSEETQRILQHIQSVIEECADALLKPSIGVLSPFREQAQFLEKEILASLSDDTIQAHKLRIDTPYGFQGEERDLMLLSMAIDDRSGRASAYLNREDMFNVAVTRAKERMQVFYSVDPKQLSTDNLFRRYLEHNHLPNANIESDEARCEFANSLAQSLSSSGYQCWLGFEIAGVEIDVLCQKDGRLLGVDLIGFPGDFQDFYDVDTYKSLFRSGISVLPMPYSAWLQDQHGCLNCIDEYFSQSL
ncbi:DEAD/DEAH box helicase [Litoribrevibacter euphylliae]|uniref:DEAD/DEAH box helicase n=1 Tax=Litoribrevibacter euphylliae TaxID=1834034 RepID=A0ABV7HG40_9GAMM